MSRRCEIRAVYWYRTMKILIADDDQMTRRLLTFSLSRWQRDLTAVATGDEAWAFLSEVEAPCLAILDWMMPGLDGHEICQLVTEHRRNEAIYLILLTSNNEKKDVVSGLDAGANDYVVKPFDEGELYARIQVGLRMLDLQQRLADRISELTRERAKVKQLQQLLPICAYCKKIRDDQNYWRVVESYFSEHADVQFSHGICPPCLKKALDELPEPCGEEKEIAVLAG
jgi:PleD family two-component response regulator